MPHNINNYAKFANRACKIVCCAVLLLSTIGCNKSARDAKNIKAGKFDEGAMYEKCQTMARDGSYIETIDCVESMETQVPASGLIPNALTLKVYAAYKLKKYAEAESTFNSFISQYPAHINAAYMHYMNAMGHYDQISDVNRDQKKAETALEALDVLINRFPNTKYAQDAIAKRTFVYNTLAGKEMVIGRFYMKNNEPMAAIGRFKAVIERYQKSIFIEEALYRATELYTYFGLPEEAKKYASVLGSNYPASPWYKKAYALVR